MTNKEEELNEETKRFIKKVGYDKGFQEGKAQRDKEIKMSKKQFNEIMDKQEEFFYNQGKEQIPKGYVKLKDIEKIMDKYEYRLCKKLTFEDLKKELKEKEVKK